MNVHLVLFKVPSQMVGRYLGLAPPLLSILNLILKVLRFKQGFLF